MFFWCLQFPPKNERKQVDLRFHSSKVEFLHSFFGGNVGMKKSFRLCLTFTFLIILWLLIFLGFCNSSTFHHMVHNSTCCTWRHLLQTIFFGSQTCRSTCYCKIAFKNSLSPKDNRNLSPNYWQTLWSFRYLRYNRGETIQTFSHKL